LCLEMTGARLPAPQTGVFACLTPAQVVTATPVGQAAARRRQPRQILARHQPAARAAATRAEMAARRIRLAPIRAAAAQATEEQDRLEEESNKGATGRRGDLENQRTKIRNLFVPILAVPSSPHRQRLIVYLFPVALRSSFGCSDLGCSDLGCSVSAPDQLSIASLLLSITSISEMILSSILV
jgi:hypothetical protein